MSEVRNECAGRLAWAKRSRLGDLSASLSAEALAKVEAWAAEKALPPSRHGKAPLRRDDGQRSLERSGLRRAQSSRSAGSAILVYARARKARRRGVCLKRIRQGGK
ncbi:MAG: hypothetical protein L6437_00645 [Kiritimatiellae bacterium]|nr:hypothetical protein [Verrucomicrobiota bacterium]MBU4286434.1 hypothetical protein [Verrucomicrobiota bacterium]MBU4366785.1 hypothetical protein [Verrucomicrobiota bacterium]MCG2658739.1 hypothetical protein [Kiritimatiellia bacterium]